MNYQRVLLIVLCIAVFIAVISISLYPNTYTKSIWWERVRGDCANNSVTKIIHQSWKDSNVPERFKNYSKSWTQYCFKDWKYFFWTDNDNMELVKVHYPWFLEKYKKLPSGIHRADVLRYFYMFHYGGIYTDLDNECLRPFGHLLVGFSLVFGAMRGQYGGTSLKEGYVQNSFFYSIPRHPFWMEMIIGVFSNPTNSAPEGQTGPVLLSKLLKAIIDRNVQNHTIKIYEPDVFNPFSWIDRRNLDVHCKDFGRMSYEDWQLCKASMLKRGSYVVQYHAHSWG